MSKKYASQQFLNRELGQLEFNRRVLAQAEDSSVPLLERPVRIPLSRADAVRRMRIRLGAAAGRQGRVA